jgi:hypothetical protein
VSDATVRLYCDHEILHDQWCEACLTSAAVTVVVKVLSDNGVTSVTKTACPRCGAGLTPKEIP